VRRGQKAADLFELKTAELPKGESKVSLAFHFEMEPNI
jgi:hypothetical protein